MISGLAIDAVARGAGNVDMTLVLAYCALMIVFYVVSSALSYLLSIFMVGITQKVVVALRRDLFNRLIRLPVSYFDNAQTGDILSRISYDIDTIANTLSSDAVQIFTGVFTVIGSFVLMLTISPALVLIFAVTIPVSVFATRYLVKKVKPLFRARSGKLGTLNGYAEEKISGHKTIKAYNAESSIIGGFDALNSDAADAYCKADYYGTVTGPTMNLVNNISIALVSMFGVLLYLIGGPIGITLGNLSSFTLYSRKFAGPINEFGNILSELQSAAAAAERVMRIIDEAPEPPDAEEAAALSGVQGFVTARDVNFSYVEGRPILRNVEFDAPPGKTVAIVGPTGGGKTTVINLLMRFYDPDSGEIRIDGTEIREAARASVRAAYSMVLQDTWLFCGTVYENIAYSRDTVTRGEVEEAARAARIDGYVESLPDGYDSVLDEGGMNISKGQKQLISIARAMLSDAGMLILDEATSNVDTRTEMEIQRAMLRLMRGKTCFVIAHRLSTIVNADIILVIKDGEIIERGNHAELISRDSYYKQMYSSQFE
jgi:ATP-binding cassette subfamily B protein